MCADVYYQTYLFKYVHNSPQVLDEIVIWIFTTPFQHRDLVSVFSNSVTTGSILFDDRAVVDVHVQYQFLFEQFHVLGFIHSGVRRNEIQTSSTPNQFARRVFYTNIGLCLIKTLTKLLHGAWCIRQKRGAGRSSEVERSLMVRWVVGSILHGVDPLSYFSFQPVLHDWCNKGRGMCLSCLWDGAYKRTLAVNQ